jgi:hypothetical protein
VYTLRGGRAELEQENGPASLYLRRKTG